MMIPLLLAATLALSAPQQSPPDSVSTNPVEVVDESVQTGDRVAGLPLRAPPPRTLEEYWVVFAGFVVVWLGIVGYVLTLGRRSRRVAESLASVDRGSP